MAEVILKVTDLKVSTQFNQTSINVQPIGDILYSVEIPDLTPHKDGQLITSNGIRMIIKALLGTLVIDVDKGDF